jgi:hypothetical protein
MLAKTCATSGSRTNTVSRPQYQRFFHIILCAYISSRAGERYIFGLYYKQRYEEKKTRSPSREVWKMDGMKVGVIEVRGCETLETVGLWRWYEIKLGHSEKETSISKRLKERKRSHGAGNSRLPKIIPTSISISWLFFLCSNQGLFN